MVSAHSLVHAEAVQQPHAPRDHRRRRQHRFRRWRRHRFALARAPRRDARGATRCSASPADLVSGLQTAFAENWLEATGEILTDRSSFPAHQRPPADGTAGLVAIGTPSPARSSPARVLFQVLLAAAREVVDINSPYFLPDRSARRELIAAVARGVRMRIITPGRVNNHPLARRASRRRYGELLEAGVEIHEFQPGMIHAKIFVVDGLGASWDRRTSTAARST